MIISGVDVGDGVHLRRWEVATMNGQPRWDCENRTELSRASEPVGTVRRVHSQTGVLGAPWSFTRCFSANVSAASLFENVATTSPFASPTLTSNLAPSWVTVYVFMLSVPPRFAGYDPIRGIKLM